MSLAYDVQRSLFPMALPRLRVNAGSDERPVHPNYLIYMKARTVHVTSVSSEYFLLILSVLLIHVFISAFVLPEVTSSIVGVLVA